MMVQFPQAFDLNLSTSGVRVLASFEDQKTKVYVCAIFQTVFQIMESES